MMISIFGFPFIAHNFSLNISFNENLIPLTEFKPSIKNNDVGTSEMKMEF